MKPILSLVFLWFLVMPEIPAIFWTRDMIIPIDPRQFNYCSTPCLNPRDQMNPYRHVACDCDRVEEVRHLITDNLDTYRKLILDIHNERRNRIASGAEPECLNCPKASNMMLLNYDLELEYIAGCHLKRRNLNWTFDDNDNFCKRKALHPFNTGINVVVDNSSTVNNERKLKNDKEIKDFIINIVKFWYYEFKKFSNISKIIRRFEGGKTASTDENFTTFTHFTQLIWGSLSHVGCAIGWRSAPTYQRAYLECHYAGWKGGPNILNEPVYVAGEPCTRCPFGTKCEGRAGLEALCGHLKPIPAEMSAPESQSKLTNFKLSPNVNQFPLMYGQKTEKDQTNIANGLIPMASSSPKSSPMTIIIIMIWIFYFD